MIEEKNEVKMRIISKPKLVLIAILVLVLIIGGTYSWLLLTKNSQVVNKITAGNLELSLDESTTNGIKLLNAVPMTYQKAITDTDKYTFTLKNTGNISATYQITLDDISEFVNDNSETVQITSENRLADNYIRYILTKGAEEQDPAKSKLLSTATDRVIDEGKIAGNSQIEYTLQLWIDSRAGNNNTQDDVMGKYFGAKLNIVGEQILGEQIRPKFVSAYTYNQTSGAENYCVTGEEATCQATECYKTKTAGSCPAGTIIKYKVNDTTTETFHVMYDRANSITMQTQKNTVYNTAWYSSADDNSKGPITILPALESATSSWTNVEDQTYIMGTTNFPIGDEGQFPSANSGTSCTVTSCSGNKYTLAERTAKARMITVQETAMLGCTDTKQSCPVWMNNYLQDSTDYGGTVNDKSGGKNNYGYWTMSAYSYLTNSALSVISLGVVYYDSHSNTNYGARAVVVVSK